MLIPATRSLGNKVICRYLGFTFQTFVEAPGEGLSIWRFTSKLFRSDSLYNNMSLLSVLLFKGFPFQLSKYVSQLSKLFLEKIPNIVPSYVLANHMLSPAQEFVFLSIRLKKAILR